MQRRGLISNVGVWPTAILNQHFQSTLLGGGRGSQKRVRCVRSWKWWQLWTTPYREFQYWRVLGVEKSVFWKSIVLDVACQLVGWACKDELVALAYTATVAKLPCVLSKNEESQCVLVAAEYKQLLATWRSVKLLCPIHWLNWQLAGRVRKTESKIKTCLLFRLLLTWGNAARLVGLISEKGSLKELTQTLQCRDPVNIF